MSPAMNFTLQVAVVFISSFNYITYLLFSSISKRQSSSRLTRAVPSVNIFAATIFAAIVIRDIFESSFKAYVIPILLFWILAVISFIWDFISHQLTAMKPRQDPPASMSEALLGTQSHSEEIPECIDVSSQSIFNRITFSWMNSIIHTGSKRALTVEDCPKLGPLDWGRAQYEKLQKNWRQQNLLGKSPSLVRVLWNAYWVPMLINGVFGGLYLLCLYTGPVMLGVLVNFVAQEDRSLLEGVGLVAIVLVAKTFQSVLERAWHFGTERLGIWIRSALTGAVYDKGLKLSNVARATHGAGEIVNYLAVDVQRVADFTWWMHDTWLLPTQTIIALIILFRTVGWGSISGIVILFICLSLQIPLARKTEQIQSKVMKAKDARMKATTECLKSMRVIKLWAWEDFFRTRIETLRGSEFNFLLMRAGLTCLNLVLIYLCPLLVATFTLATCVLLGDHLTSAQVFTAIATFRILQDPIFLLPMLITQLVEASVSVGRLESLFRSAELDKQAVDRPISEFGSDYSEKDNEIVVRIADGSFGWDGNSSKDNGQILHHINLEVTKGAHVAVCGSVGSGKSSLLAAIMGEMDKSSGTVNVSGRVAYVAQSAWIQSGTIEYNVKFGQPVSPGLYSTALQVCCLGPDLAALPAGDHTEIGERGINVSGGQKQRIQLARAVCSDADLYLLDDPFSAVDAHTGSDLFKECVMGALGTKTVILVTHQVEFLPAMDLIYVMKDGKIVQAGKYEDLLLAGTDFSSLIDAHHQAMDSVGDASSSALEAPMDGEEHAPANGPIISIDGGVTPSNDDASKSGQLVEEEEKEVGAVGMGVYVSYLTKVWGGGLVPIILLMLFAYQVTQISANYWLSYATTPENNVSPLDLIRMYSWLVCGGIVFAVVRIAAVNFGGAYISQGFYKSMLRSIFRSPMAFFDTTPTGRILSRASSDQATLDLNLAGAFSGTARNMFEIGAIIFVTASITPQMLLASIPCGVAIYFLQRYYLKSSREFMRIQGTRQAPIINHFSESVAGAMTIRAFQKQDEFFSHNLDLVDVLNRPILLNSGATQWFMLRLDLLSAATFGTIALLLVSLPGSFISPALVGLSLAYALGLNESLIYWAWWSSQLENKIVSVERIQQYVGLPEEAPAVMDNSQPPSDWPTHGTIQFDSLQVKYRDDTPLVLRDLSCIISGGDKVGVVGRTGSGKSTLIQALFRIVEPSGGRIVIDGVDVATIGLKDLRQKLSVIPQEPTLFEGSVRLNLDPLEQFSDQQIWEALDRCQLGDTIRGKEGGLHSQVAENGDNWSVGQRQLFCLGRALLKRSKILVLDEATASVDSATDALIQQTLTASFSDCTVISVAHRIPTVIDSDKVLVLDKGVVAEYDSPKRLLENRSSLFSKLVAEYSKRSEGMGSYSSVSRASSYQTLAD